MTIIEDIKRAAKLLNAIPPVPIAIWFIDCDALYRNFIYSNEITLMPELQTDGSLSCFAGIPGLKIIQTSTREIEARIRNGISREQERDSFLPLIEEIYPFRKKGVWVQMNKGEHYTIVENRLIPVRSFDDVMEKSLTEYAEVWQALADK